MKRVAKTLLNQCQEKWSMIGKPFFWAQFTKLFKTPFIDEWVILSPLRVINKKSVFAAPTKCGR